MEIPFQVYYDNLKEKLSTRSYNILRKHDLLVVQNIIPWIFGKEDFNTLNGCGIKSVEELSAMCDKLRDVLSSALTCSSAAGDILVDVSLGELKKKEAVPAPQKVRKQVKPTLDDKKLPLREYLLQSDLDFVKGFYEVNKRLPLFYILQVCYTRSCKVNDVFLSGAKPKIRSFLKREEWEAYSVVKAHYVYSGHFRYGKMCAQEQITKEQLMELLVLLGKKVLYVRPESTMVVKVKPEPESGPCYELLVSEQLSLFKYKKMIKEVKRLNDLRRTKDESFPVNTYFVDNVDYWDNSILPDEDIREETTHLVEEIIESVFGDVIMDGVIVFEKIRPDYRDVVYQILKDAGHRMHIADIFEQFKQRCPECGFTKPDQIRYYMKCNEEIIPVGKKSTFALKEWGEMIGSIRELSLKILRQQKDPIPMEWMCDEILTYRPDSSRKSISTIIQQEVDKGEFVLFFGDTVGLQGRVYEGDNVIVPRTFDGWLSLYNQFVVEHGWHPLSGSKGVEGYLYRWAYKLNRTEETTDDMKQRFSKLLDQLSSYPRTTQEIKFLRDCEDYKDFVKKKERMVELSDDPVLCMWFKKWEYEYKRLTDNRKRYFEELLSFLKEKLGNPVSPQAITPTEMRFARNCNAYRMFVQKKGRKVERMDDPILFTWFDNCTQKYSLLNRRQQEYFDELLQFLVDKI